MADAGGLARNRLLMERKAWRKNKPFGFHARPETEADGCVIGGHLYRPPNYAWANACYGASEQGITMLHSFQQCQQVFRELSEEMCKRTRRFRWHCRVISC